MLGPADEQYMSSDGTGTEQTQTIQSCQTIFHNILFFSMLESTEQNEGKKTIINAKRLYNTRRLLPRYCRASATERDENVDKERQV